MNTKPAFVARETKLRRVVRLVLKGGGVAILGLMPLWYFGYAPREGSLYSLFYDLTMGLLAISIPVYLYSLYRQIDLVAAVGDEGVSFTRPGPGGWPIAVTVRWEQLRAIEIVQARKWWKPLSREQVLVRLFNEQAYADFSLKRLRQNISDQFIVALRQHWPDLDRPWQVQMANRKTMDSDAP